MPTNQAGKTYEEVYGKSPAINSQTLTQEPDFQLPDFPQEQPYDLTSIPITDLTSAANQPTAAEQQQGTYENRFLSAINQLSGKESAQYEAEKNAGLPAFQQQLTDINGQLTTLQNEAKAIPLRLQEQAQGRGITAGGLQPIQTAELRRNAINALSLSSVAQALQGNISLAQQQADRAVEVQFAPIEREIAYLREAMNINEKRMGREDQKRQRQLDIVLNERERMLANAKENQKIIIGWAAEASKLGNAPSLIVNKALASKDPREALAILAPYMSDPMEKEAALLDLDFKREQIKNAQYNRYLQGEELKLSKERLALDREISFAKLQEEADKAATTASSASNTRADAISLVNDILGSDYSDVVGSPNLLTARGPFAASSLFSSNSNAGVRAKIDQLRSILALEARDKLKGSGAVSDYESRILNNSTAALGNRGWFAETKVGEAEFAQELNKLRGVLTVMNGGTAKVQMQSPTGEVSPILEVNREAINKAAQDGFTILYK